DARVLTLDLEAAVPLPTKSPIIGLQNKDALFGARQGDSHAAYCNRSRRNGIPSLCSGLGWSDSHGAQASKRRASELLAATRTEPGHSGNLLGGVPCRRLGEGIPSRRPSGSFNAGAN